MNSINEKQKFIASNTAATQQYRDTIQSIRTDVITNPNNVSIRYKVKKGDYPAKIAKFFYNDWSMYKKIERDNNLHQPYILKVGQILIIKINQ
jgi:nucleoid-associated protein YgaU